MKLPVAWCIFVFEKYRLIRPWNTLRVNYHLFITCDIIEGIRSLNIDSHNTTHCMPTLTISCGEFWSLYGSWYHGYILITCYSFRGLFLRHWKKFVHNWAGIPGNFLEGRRNTAKCLIQGGWCPARGSKQKPVKCNFRVLQMEHPAWSVKDYNNVWYSWNILVGL